MMSTVGQREIRTQKRVIAFFKDALGYAYLGNWQDRVNNCNIERELVTDWLKEQGHSGKIINDNFYFIYKGVANGYRR